MRIEVRAARREDAPHLARLTDLAGDGLPRVLWRRAAMPWEDAFDVGARRAARDAGPTTWRRALVAEADGLFAGCVSVGVLPDAPTPGVSVPDCVRSLQELEDLAPGTLHLSALAVYPALRRRGVAQALLDAALARAEPWRAASLIVGDGNAAARALYARFGFRRRAARPIAPEARLGPSRRWFLLRRPPACDLAPAASRPVLAAEMTGAAG